MPVLRVYLPVGPVDLKELAERGSLSTAMATPATLRVAYAVTPELVRSMPGHDVEDLEYAAFSDAVAAAGAHPAGDPAGRRVVMAADVDPGWLAASEPGSQPGSQPGSRPDSICAIALTAPVPLARVASFHVDDRGGSTVDARAAASADALLWYDATELDAVRGFFA